MESHTLTSSHHESWNKGKLIGQKASLKRKEIWGRRSEQWAPTETSLSASLSTAAAW